MLGHIFHLNSPSAPSDNFHISSNISTIIAVMFSGISSKNKNQGSRAQTLGLKKLLAGAEEE